MQITVDYINDFDNISSHQVQILVWARGISEINADRVLVCPKADQIARNSLSNA